MLKKHYWPPMNADERGLKDAKAFVFHLNLGNQFDASPVFARAGIRA